MSHEKLQPLNDHLVVEPIQPEQKTKTGLVLPETAAEKPQQGRVLAVGPGRRDDDGKRISMDVSVGDLVIFEKYAGMDYKMSGKKFLILEEPDILAIIED